MDILNNIANLAEKHDFSFGIVPPKQQGAKLQIVLKKGNNIRKIDASGISDKLVIALIEDFLKDCNKMQIQKFPINL
jgi:hypothetical protein